MPTVNRSPLLLIAPCLALAAGCGAGDTARPASGADVARDRRVETDGSLGDTVVVRQVRQATVQGDLPDVDVEVLNADPQEADIDYRFEWFDDHGMPVDAPASAWNTQHLGPRQTVSLVSVAPTPRCKDFRLKLQRSQRL